MSGRSGLPQPIPARPSPELGSRHSPPSGPDAIRGQLMRYKASPLSIRDAAAPAAAPAATLPRTRRAGRPRPVWLLLLLVPALVLPWSSVSAGAGISLSPSTGPIGATIQLAGQGFAPNSRGQILFDGTSAGMPTYRVDHSGQIQTSF